MTQQSINGDAFDLSRSRDAYSVAVAFSVAQSATAYFQIKTSTKEALLIHWSLEAATQSVEFIAVEAPTVTDGTTAITPVNINRSHTNGTTLTLYSNPTSISGGTTLIDSVVPSAGNKTGGGLATSIFWTLAANTDYVASIENLGNSTTACTFEMAWVELGPS